MRFYTGSMFPRVYKNAIIIARRGSWNRSKKVGGDVVVVKLNKDGTMKSMEPLITGFIENNNYIGRPVDVMQMKDGSLLVSDDYNGAVYRVTYGKQKVAAPLRPSLRAKRSNPVLTKTGLLRRGVYHRGWLTAGPVGSSR